MHLGVGLGTAVWCSWLATEATIRSSCTDGPNAWVALKCPCTSHNLICHKVGNCLLFSVWDALHLPERQSTACPPSQTCSVDFCTVWWLGCYTERHTLFHSSVVPATWLYHSPVEKRSSRCYYRIGPLTMNMHWNVHHPCRRWNTSYEKTNVLLLIRWQLNSVFWAGD